FIVPFLSPQDEYSIFPQTYSIDINGYILVYSVTSNKSFEVVQVIHEKLLDMVGKVQVPIMLVGNKNDLHMERVISCEEGKALADSWNAAFMESSAKENQVPGENISHISGECVSCFRSLRTININTPKYGDIYKIAAIKTYSCTLNMIFRV
ncbi:GTP-binding protein Rheb-like, partial [Hippocampus comes]|uniref:GTP-binding protein Rheb-like n=1 Tax=Hippocampus comes TaxID=109280 RepID=UPI00094F0DCA